MLRPLGRFLEARNLAAFFFVTKFVLERSPCEMPILDNSGISYFLKRGGVPLPVNSEVLGTYNFDVDTTRETLAKNDRKCRRVLEQKRWFEWPAVIRF